MKIVKLIFALSVLLIFVSYLAYAQQYHPADEITPGTFTAGHYTFRGNLTFTNQPSSQIKIIPSDDLRPTDSVITIMKSDGISKSIELTKGGYLIAKRIGLGLSSGEVPKYDLDVPKGEIHGKNLTLAGGPGFESPAEIAFEGSIGYINTFPTGNIYIGSGISGNISNVNIGGNLTIEGRGGNVCHNIGGTWYSCPPTNIGGSGDINYLAKFTDSTTIGNSAFYESGDALYDADDSVVNIGENLAVDGVIKSTSPGDYPQVELRQWGLYGAGQIYIEPYGGNTLWLTDQWSGNGKVHVVMDRLAVGPDSSTENIKLYKNGAIVATSLDTQGQTCPGGWTCEVNTWDIVAQSAKLYGYLDVSGDIYSNDGALIRNRDWDGSNPWDAGIYSNEPGWWMRFVTNNAEFNWFSDGGTGTNPIMNLKPTGDLNVKGSVKIGGGYNIPCDSTTVGTMRYYEICPFGSTYYSRFQVCMRTGDATYDWQTIKEFSWSIAPSVCV